MSTFSHEFHINKTQAQLDFVDIDLAHDIPLYLDPYALTTRDDEWSINCHDLVVSFFTAVLDAIKRNDHKVGIHLLSHLGEPEETHLGVSKPGNAGRGIGPVQAKLLFAALKNSKAAKSGLLQDLPDIALFIPLIARDKISDMTTNIIRRELIKYTQNQCMLHNVPMELVSSGMYWEPQLENWHEDYVYLPVFNQSKILLVPKYSVRRQVGVDHATYRSRFVLDYLQEHALKANDRLVTTLKTKKGVVTQKVFKKDVDNDPRYPKTKDFLAEFSAAHPAVIKKYKEMLKDMATKVPTIAEDNYDEKQLARYLADELKAIPGGGKTADVYHELIIGIVSFMYFPNLIYPKKEAPLNEGRKRIDILCTNGKDSGFFRRIAIDQNIKANLVTVECKNYTNDIANAEFDQLIGRFDPQRGKLGLLFYRSNTDEKLVLKRCKDAARSDQGIILPINDKYILEALDLVIEGKRPELDRQINDLYTAVIS